MCPFGYRPHPRPLSRLSLPSTKQQPDTTSLCPRCRPPLPGRLPALASASPLHLLHSRHPLPALAPASTNAPAPMKRRVGTCASHACIGLIATASPFPYFAAHARTGLLYHPLLRRCARADEEGGDSRTCSMRLMSSRSPRRRVARGRTGGSVGLWCG